ncbi:MAG: phospholipid carrier-dependent glycosyltransferase [Chloroflexota bacterium]
MQRQSLGLALILILYSIIGSLYIVSVPLFEASDEAEHFIHIHTILETNALPIIQSREQMTSQTDPVLRWNNQSHHAPLYYMTSALLISWSERADLADYLHPNELIFLRNTVENNPNKWLHRYTEPSSDTYLAVYQLRVMNLLIGAGTLLMIFGASRQITDKYNVPYLAILLTASIPTFLVVNTSVTNDALVIFLYSAGIYWCMKAWRTEAFSRLDVVSISLILAGIALTKLTGVTLFAVVYGTLLFGVFRKKWTWKQILPIIVITGVATALLAGWWYLRNLSLYGDLLAVDATASIWGREAPLTLAIFTEDVRRIGKSFWMLIGYLHNPVFVADSFYIYATGIASLGVIGTIVWSQRQKQADTLLILLFCFFIVTAMLLYGTLSVDISYGRLLMPAIASVAILITIGLSYIFKRWAWLFIMPFTVTAILIPVFVVPQAYPSLTVVENIPDTATMVNWQADSLEILAIDTPDTVVHTGDIVSVDLYFRGNHPDNPAMTITAVDTIRLQRFDHHEIYPGMADMRHLPDDRIFKATIDLTMTAPDSIEPPRVVNILVEWVDLDTNTELIFDSETSLLEVMGATFVDGRYDLQVRDNEIVANFGGEIVAHHIGSSNYRAGEEMNFGFIWEATSELSTEQEAILTLQLFDSEGNVVAQNDGTLWWYPTTRWAPNVAFLDDGRTLEIPADLIAGDYQLGIGWYRVVDDTYPRLTLDGSENDLYMIPITIREAQ